MFVAIVAVLAIGAAQVPAGGGMVYSDTDRAAMTALVASVLGEGGTP